MSERTSSLSVPVLHSLSLPLALILMSCQTAITSCNNNNRSSSNDNNSNSRQSKCSVYTLAYAHLSNLTNNIYTICIYHYYFIKFVIDNVAM